MERVVVLVQGVTSKFKDNMNGAARNVRRFGSNMQSLKHRLDKVKISMLGVMFFGMAMQRTFMGLLNPVMEAFGVFDLFREMLLILFLPVMEMLFPVLLKVFDFFTNLPEPVKKVIGVFALIGLAIGSVLSFLGQLGIGITSVWDVFLGLGKLVIGFFEGISAGMIGIAAVIVAIVVGMVIAWKENFLNMKDTVARFVGGVKQLFSGIVNIIRGVMGLVVAIFTGDSEKLKRSFIQLVVGIKDLIVGAVKAVFYACGAIVTGAIRVLWGIIKTVWNIGYAIGEAIGKGLRAAADLVKKAISALLPDWLEELLSRGKQIAVTILGKVFGGGNGGRFDDFIYRPGQAPAKINPSDTVVGFKGRNPMGGGGSNITINQTLSISATNTSDIKRMIDEANRRIVDDVRRLVKQ